MKLIDDARQWWKIGSVWMFVLIGFFPDLYDGVSAMGWLDQLPGAAKWSIRALASAGIAVRLIKQKKLQACREIQDDLDR